MTDVPVATPVTTPEASTLAVEGALEVHVPPDGEADSEVVLPTHTEDDPLIGEEEPDVIV
jgi:hypothetical protein